MKSIPKLTVRDLLWLIVVVALAILWWMDHREVASLRQHLEAAQLRD